MSFVFKQSVDKFRAASEGADDACSLAHLRMTQIRLHFCGVGEGRSETSAALMWPWFKTRPITFRPLIPQKVVDDVLHLIFNSNKPVVMFRKEGDASGNLQQMVRFGYLKRLGFFIFPRLFSLDLSAYIIPIL